MEFYYRDTSPVCDMKFVLHKDRKIKFEIGERNIERFNRSNFFKEVYNSKAVYVDGKVYKKIVDCASFIENMGVIVSPKEPWDYRSNNQPVIVVYNDETYVLDESYYWQSEEYERYEKFLEVVRELRDIFLEVTYDGSLYENVRY